MYRTSVIDILDSLRKEFDILIQENIALKQHIKELEDKYTYHITEINKARMYILELQDIINNKEHREYKDSRINEHRENNIKEINSRESSDYYNNTNNNISNNTFTSNKSITNNNINIPDYKLLKLGYDWRIEGTPILNIFLKSSISYFKIISDIYVYRNKNNMIIGIINNKRAYLITNGNEDNEESKDDNKYYNKYNSNENNKNTTNKIKYYTFYEDKIINYIPNRDKEIMKEPEHNILINNDYVYILCKEKKYKNKIINIIKIYSMKDKILINKIEIEECQNIKIIEDNIIVSNNFHIKVYDINLNLISDSNRDDEGNGININNVVLIASTLMYCYGITTEKKIIVFEYKNNKIKECKIDNNLDNKNIISIDIYNDHDSNINNSKYKNINDNNKNIIGYLVMGCSDGIIYLYGIGEDLELLLLNEYNHYSIIYSVRFLRINNDDNNRNNNTIKDKNNVDDDNSTDDIYIISSGKDCSYKLWSISDKNMVRCMGHRDAIYKINSCNTDLVTVSADGRLRVWEIENIK